MSLALFRMPIVFVLHICNWKKEKSFFSVYYCLFLLVLFKLLNATTFKNKKILQFPTESCLLFVYTGIFKQLDNCRCMFECIFFFINLYVFVVGLFTLAHFFRFFLENIILLYVPFIYTKRKQVCTWFYMPSIIFSCCFYCVTF